MLEVGLVLPNANPLEVKSQGDVSLALCANGGVIFGQGPQAALYASELQI